MPKNMTFIAILLALMLPFFNASTFAQESSVFVDARDGKSYRWVNIGGQIWIGANLDFIAPGSGVFAPRFGRLYNWEQAVRACPNGWHLPSDEEWMRLESYAGMSNAGKRLKSRTGWKFYLQDGNGTDVFGFRALPGGYYQYYTQRFMLYGTNIAFWSRTSVDSKNAIVRSLDSMYDNIKRHEMYKVHGAYVRCLRD